VRFDISRRVVLGEHLNDGGVIIAGMIRCAWGQERHNATQGKDGDGQDRHAGLCDHHRVCWLHRRALGEAQGQARRSRLQGPCRGGADTALVEKVSVTPLINDGKATHETLPDDPGQMFADGAYCGAHFS